MNQSINVHLSHKLKVLSFILIVMVVFVHSNLLPENASVPCRDAILFFQYFWGQGLGRVAVPLFFAISGFLYFNNFECSLAGILFKFNKRTKTLLIPYLSWSLLGLLAYGIFQSIPQTRVYFTNPDILLADKSVFTLASLWIIEPIPYQLWFLIDLILLVLVSPAIYLCIRSRVCLPFFVMLFTLWLNDINPPFQTRVGEVLRIEGVFWFVFGGIIASCRGFLVFSRTPSENWLLFSSLFLWVSLGLCYAYLKVYTNAPDITLLLVNRFSILSGIPAIWLAYEKGRSFFETRAMAWFADSTFFVYVSHEPLLTFCKKLALPFLKGNVFTLGFGYIIIPVIVILFCIFIGKGMARLMPGVHAVLTGGRGANAVKL